LITIFELLPQDQATILVQGLREDHQTQDNPTSCNPANPINPINPGFFFDSSLLPNRIINQKGKKRVFG